MNGSVTTVARSAAPSTGKASAPCHHGAGCACPACARPGMPLFLQRAASLPVSQPGDAAEAEADAVSRRVVPGDGSRIGMERAFGADFGGVRVHADNEADRAGRALQARAFTIGEDIYVRPHEFRPHEEAGRRLLAHELAHVVQARAGRGAAIQRQVDAGTPGRHGVPDAGTPPACPDPLPEFPANTSYTRVGTRFEANYQPTAVAPHEDDLTITHRIHLDFRPFRRALIWEQPALFGKYRRVRFTAAQRAEFEWDDTERTTFRNDFRTNVQGAWSRRHRLDTDEACFARYRAMPVVRIEFVDDPAQAHSTMIVYKMPPDTARLRSEVRGGSAATLESRDPSVPTTKWVAPAEIIRQIGPFDFDKSDINSDVEADVQEFAGLVRPHVDASRPDDPFPPDSCLNFAGRASSEGSVAYNHDLARRRVTAVNERLHDVLGVPRPRVTVFIGNEPGERNATTDPRFRRVDATFSTTCPTGGNVSQNVAAHEFGHLIGFGDEYVDERPPRDVLPKFEGDRPTHYGDVEAWMGAAAANDLLVQDSGSIMAAGSEVRRGHYVYFLEAISVVTGKRWKVA